MLLVKLIWLLIANAGVAALVVVIVKIVDDAGLGIGQVGEDGPLPGFEFFNLRRDHRLSAWVVPGRALS